ncbi:MAG TPA: aspartate-semialdehyde dehydrogenase [Terriglobales bacterium]|nr:aspartate-semialdehyde dehydrogenase [Terriglobales bacterium]
MKETARVAIVGATGLVGREILAVLEQRLFPLEELQLYASLRSAGEVLDCGGLSRRVELLDTARFDETDLVFLAAGEAVSAEIAERASAVATVIDVSQLFADDIDVPLVVPEVNAVELARTGERGIVASPDSAAVALAVALRPFAEGAGLRRVVATSFEAVSGAGQAGIDELQRQTIDLLSGRSTEPAKFEQRIAFNLFPQVGEFLEGGASRGEQLVSSGIRRILDRPDLPVSITRVRVPLFFGQAIALNLETDQHLPVAAVREMLRSAPGVLVEDELSEGQFPTPATAVSEDAISIGRIRTDAESSTVDLWIASDNLRKGSAVNAVQIAEILMRDYL